MGWLAGIGRLTPDANAQYNRVVRASAEVPAGGSGANSTARSCRSPEPKIAPITEIDARKAKAPPRFEVKAPQGRPERRHRPDRRHRLRPFQRLRRPVPDADLREAGQQRAALQSLPHHRPVLADADRPADRPQPPRQQRRRHHGDGDRVPRQHGRPARERRAAGRDPAPERLQHRRLRQVSRDAAVGSLGLGAVRSLADALGVRQVLRLHRRRNEPVGAGGLRRRRPRRGAARSRTTTSPPT